MHIIPSSAYYLNPNSELWLLSLQNFVHSSSVTDNTTVVHSFVEINLLIFNVALHTKQLNSLQFMSQNEFKHLGEAGP